MLTDMIAHLIAPGTPAFLMVCVTAYVIFASFMTYALFGIDRDRRASGGRRIPQAQLLILCGLGGWPGAKMAQIWHGHLSRVQPFCNLVNLIAVGQILWVLAFGLPVGKGVAALALALFAPEVAVLAKG